MATGGRVLHHLETLLPDARNAVVLTGYQGVGTRGRQLSEGAEQVKINGRYVPVRAEVYHDREFSVHADGSDLIDWLRDLSPAPETVFCTHGEEGSAEALAARIRTELGLTVTVPKYGERVSLSAKGTYAPLSPLSGEVSAASAPRPQKPAPTTTRPSPGGSLPVRKVAGTLRQAQGTGADDMEQVAVIVETAIGQVAFLPEAKQAEVSELLHGVLELVRSDAPDLGQVREGVNLALYAAAGAVETPGGQSIVALLAHVPKIIS